MDQTPARLSAKPSWLLTRLAVHAPKVASNRFGEIGARGYHYRIMAALDEFGAAGQTELGRRCDMDRSDVVAAINEPAEQGFVVWTPDPQDRRRHMTILAEAGNRQLRRLDRALDQVQDELLGPLPAEDRQTLTRLLARLLTHHQQG
ncbi:MarR family winged helix-turn-helix transcriptional regulator [Nocardia brevicatena]|uniref:MarR family winged helix-turn-helix transcriptional regulator n=1 Tax=Nocardia brevicatena TaxID=37327 RepID=UPI000305014B|nr:MarR family winged helix-turn-helix transcriptional regulator [Nocardia brevicatena]